MNRRDMVCVFDALIKWCPDKSQRAVILCEINDSLIGPESDPETIAYRNLFWDTWEDRRAND